MDAQFREDGGTGDSLASPINGLGQVQYHSPVFRMLADTSKVAMGGFHVDIYRTVVVMRPFSGGKKCCVLVYQCDGRVVGYGLGSTVC